jgi:hypothetical protein
MDVVFFNTSSMLYYKGHNENDVPENGGKFIHDNGYGLEEYNFLPRQIQRKGMYCLGYVETKSTVYGRNTLHIERIRDDISLADDAADGILVVWCAKSRLNGFTVVGWYKNAQVFREAQSHKGKLTGDQYYRAISKKDDCVLLPVFERDKEKWKVPRAASEGNGFGQSMIWYADRGNAEEYVKKLVNAINQYDGNNWIDTSTKTESDTMYEHAEEMLITSSEEFDEGSQRLVQHMQRERSQLLIQQAKQEYLRTHPRFVCQICGFNFEQVYGERGQGLIESHHNIPVSELRAGDKTRIEDIIFVCANCHRMIHRKQPWMTSDEFGSMIKQRS